MKELLFECIQKHRQVTVWVDIAFVCYPVAAFFQPFLYMLLMNGENGVVVDYILVLPTGMDSWC